MIRSRWSPWLLGTSVHSFVLHLRSTQHVWHLREVSGLALSGHLQTAVTSRQRNCFDRVFFLFWQWVRCRNFVRKLTTESLFHQILHCQRLLGKHSLLQGTFLLAGTFSGNGWDGVLGWMHLCTRRTLLSAHVETVERTQSRESRLEIWFCDASIGTRGRWSLSWLCSIVDTSADCLDERGRLFVLRTHTHNLTHAQKGHQLSLTPSGGAGCCYCCCCWQFSKQTNWLKTAPYCFYTATRRRPRARLGLSSRSQIGAVRRLRRHLLRPSGASCPSGSSGTRLQPRPLRGGRDDRNLGKGWGNGGVQVGADHSAACFALLQGAQQFGAHWRERLGGGG